jgi:IclR family pca regulon transcriptional regulator
LILSNYQKVLESIDNRTMFDYRMIIPKNDPDFMTSLARGLAVLRCFAEHQKPMTIAEASRRTGLSRAAVRRCLHTLTVLGYAARETQNYVLQPMTLSLGYAYLSSSTLAMRAQPLLDAVRDELHESCSIGVLEEDEVYYVARAEVSRIMSIALRAGSRLPLYCTSMGRVLLAGRPRVEQEAYLRRIIIAPLTTGTVTNRAHLLEIFAHVAEEGYAIVDQELETGLRSIAVPVLKAGQVIAAVNVGIPSSRASLAEMRATYLPLLRKLAHDLGRTLN